ncbi:MAG: hypothetical protein E4H20_11065, partial [Spirochaetales bacterium]
MVDIKKVYDYKPEAVRDTLLGALKKRKGEATTADLVAYTGLPKYQVETELPALADEYLGRLKVTQSGEILYSFPRGFTSRYRGFGLSLRRGLKAVRKFFAAVATYLFKAWIMVMLVGYFVLFLVLIVLSVVASFAGSASNRSSRSRSKGGGMMLTGRLIELFIRIWFYNELFKSPYQRRAGIEARDRKRGNRRPLHKAIFSFVFGEPDPNGAHDAVEKRAFIALVRARKGIVLLEDYMAITGLSPEAAESAINRYLYEFEGSPEVSDAGTVYFKFPALLKRARDDGAGASDSPFKRLRPFSANEAKSNAWYAGINGFNLVLGAYFLLTSVSYGFIAPALVTGGTWLYYNVLRLLYQVMGTGSLGFITVGLGVVPLAFSILFWLVPALRYGRLGRENERIKEENLRRVLYAQAVRSPSLVRAPDPVSLPEAAKVKNPKAPIRVLEELAAYERGDPTTDGRAWRLTELERKTADAEVLRSSIKQEDYRLGDVT